MDLPENATAGDEFATRQADTRGTSEAKEGLCLFLPFFVVLHLVMVAVSSVFGGRSPCMSPWCKMPRCRGTVERWNQKKEKDVTFSEQTYGRKGDRVELVMTGDANT